MTLYIYRKPRIMIKCKCTGYFCALFYCVKRKESYHETTTLSRESPPLKEAHPAHPRRTCSRCVHARRHAVRPCRSHRHEHGHDGYRVIGGRRGQHGRHGGDHHRRHGRRRGIARDLLSRGRPPPPHARRRRVEEGQPDRRHDPVHGYKCGRQGDREERHDRRRHRRIRMAGAWRHRKDLRRGGRHQELHIQARRHHT